MIGLSPELYTILEGLAGASAVFDSHGNPVNAQSDQDDYILLALMGLCYDSEDNGDLIFELSPAGEDMLNEGPPTYTKSPTGGLVWHLWQRLRTLERGPITVTVADAEADPVAADDLERLTRMYLCVFMSNRPNKGDRQYALSPDGRTLLDGDVTLADLYHHRKDKEATSMAVARKKHQQNSGEHMHPSTGNDVPGGSNTRVIMTPDKLRLLQSLLDGPKRIDMRQQPDLETVIAYRELIKPGYVVEGTDGPGGGTLVFELTDRGRSVAGD